MTKKELVEAMAQKTGMKVSETNKVFDAFVDVMRDTLSKGDSIQLVGTFSLKVETRPERVGRNPATGETLNIPAKKVIKFKAGKNLEDALK